MPSSEEPDTEPLPWRRIRRWPVELAFMGAATLTALLLAGLVAVLVQWPVLESWDVRVNTNLVAWVSANLWVVDPARWFSVVGLAPVIVSVCVVVAFVEYQRRRAALVVWLLGTLALGWLVGHLLKLLVDRQRPPTNGLLWDATTSSFPSGHAAVAAYGYGALALLAWWSLRGWRRLVMVAALVALGWGIAASRLVLGVHWASDVGAGYLAGLAVLLATSSWLALSSERSGQFRA